MATAAVPHKITICPPAAAGNIRDLKFDRYTATRRPFPVHAEYDGEGFTSKQLDFSDYARMSTQQRKQSGERRLPTPAFALDQNLLRAVLVRYLEKRAHLLKPQPGTERERMLRALAVIEKRRPMLESALKQMCAGYLELKRAGGDPARLKKLAEEIENFDTVLRLNTNVAGTLLRVIHLYYSVGLDSVGVGLELGLKPPHIRQILWRLNREWERMHGVKYEPKPRAPKPPRVKRESKINVLTAAQTAAASTLQIPYPTCETHRPGNRSSAAPDEYQNYVEFCNRLGSPPLPEMQWRAGRNTRA